MIKNIEKVLFFCSDFEEDIKEAKTNTKCLEAEKIKISEKPQTDAEYVR